MTNDGSTASLMKSWQTHSGFQAHPPQRSGGGHCETWRRSTDGWPLRSPGAGRASTGWRSAPPRRALRRCRCCPTHPASSHTSRRGTPGRRAWQRWHPVRSRCHQGKGQKPRHQRVFLFAFFTRRPIEKIGLPRKPEQLVTLGRRTLLIPQQDARREKPGGESVVPKTERE